MLCEVILTTTTTIKEEEEQTNKNRTPMEKGEGIKSGGSRNCVIGYANSDTK